MCLGRRGLRALHRETIDFVTHFLQQVSFWHGVPSGEGGVCDRVTGGLAELLPGALLLQGCETRCAKNTYKRRAHPNRLLECYNAQVTERTLLNIYTPHAGAPAFKRLNGTGGLEERNVLATLLNWR
ncbi:hypothetical protein NDU88_006101 [Pleurodeles waltl]|uniref:Uncharacterized protein n=1 Tax=Pleurodeles waltl TaxID=8319 RepID=A0AAV7VPK3_PLEWA|nr:hypothetical protein NDU88_006101 [Pleurodeles waltl]